MQPLCRSFDPAAVVHAVLQSRECVTADESDSVRDADFDVCVFLPVWEVRPEVIDRPNLDLPVLLEFPDFGMGQATVQYFGYTTAPVLASSRGAVNLLSRGWGLLFVSNSHETELKKPCPN